MAGKKYVGGWILWVKSLQKYVYIYIRICSIWYYVLEFHDLCYIVLLQNVVLLLLEP